MAWKKVKQSIRVEYVISQIPGSYYIESNISHPVVHGLNYASQQVIVNVVYAFHCSWKSYHFQLVTFSFLPHRLSLGMLSVTTYISIVYG